MKHFIVTRFNLKVEQWKTAKDGSLVLTEKWLEERFDLFEKYCFPSVINQKNKMFYWLIFFDIDTPDIFRKRIEKITRNYDNFKPLYIDGIKSLNNSFIQFIIENLDDKDDFIITSRLDNDDSIHQDFVYTIQNLAIKKHETVIDLRKGYQIDISNDIYECRNYSNSFNPFISLVESSDKFNTVLSRMHRDWKNSNSIIVYENLPLWIEIVHKKNKLNHTQSNIPLIKKIKLRDFGIIKKLKNRNYIFIVRNNLILKLKKSLKKSTKLKKFKRKIKTFYNPS
jgi:hypothetical protein